MRLTSENRTSVYLVEEDYVSHFLSCRCLLPLYFDSGCSWFCYGSGHIQFNSMVQGTIVLLLLFIFFFLCVTYISVRIKSCLLEILDHLDMVSRDPSTVIPGGEPPQFGCQGIPKPTDPPACRNISPG